MFDGQGRSFGVKRKYKNGTIAWWCTCRSGIDWCRATVAQKGEDFIFGKNTHNYKIKRDKSLHAKIIQKVKRDVKTIIHASTAQVIEPIFSKHFEKDPERDLPVLANVHRVARRAKHQPIPQTSGVIPTLRRYHQNPSLLRLFLPSCLKFGTRSGSPLRMVLLLECFSQKSPPLPCSCAIALMQ